MINKTISHLSFPRHATELVRFRKRVGESGLELILSESIRVNQDDDDRDLRFCDHPKNRTKTLKADRRLRTSAGRLLRKLKKNHDFDFLPALYEQVLLWLLQKISGILLANNISQPKELTATNGPLPTR